MYVFSKDKREIREIIRILIIYTKEWRSLRIKNDSPSEYDILLPILPFQVSEVHF